MKLLYVKFMNKVGKQRKWIVLSLNVNLKIRINNPAAQKNLVHFKSAQKLLTKHFYNLYQI